MTAVGQVTERQVLDELLQRRRSCRAFRPDPVSPEVLADLFALAQRTASWCNTQPWQVVVITGAATDRFARRLTVHAKTHAPRPDLEMPSRYSGIYDERRKQSGFALYESVGIAREDRTARHEQAMLNFSFFGAPHVAVVTTEPDLGVYGAVDCGGYVATLLLAAEALGLAAIAQASVAMYSDLVREHLEIGDGRDVVCAIALGYADDEHPVNAFRTPRAPVTDAVRFLSR